MDIQYTQGFTPAMRRSAAELYDEAFGAKFAVAVPDRARRTAVLEACLVPGYSFAAIVDGQLAGLAGFEVAEGSFTGGMTFVGLLKNLGVFRGLRAAAVFTLYERKAAPGELLMDGIAVHADFRGQGIGSRLLEAVAAYGRENSYNHVRLDVIDTNPRAKQLYERKGFKPVKTEEFEFLRGLLGFGASTRMHLSL